MAVSEFEVDPYERLRRMARVLASHLRIRIMIALGVRAMSPKMLEEELADDGYTVRAIEKNLEVLARFGWVVLGEAMTGGARRGATERIYRATHLPIFDGALWSALPRPIREMVTWEISQPLIRHLNDACDVGGLKASDGRHCTCSLGIVDQLGWDRIVARVDHFFEDFVEEMSHASYRLLESDEQPITTMVSLAFFESPAARPSTDTGAEQHLDLVAASSLHSFPVRLAKAIAHPLRLMILAELSVRAMSARQFFDEFGHREIEGLDEAITKAGVYRAFQTLKSFDWLVLVDKRQRGRGPSGREQFYRAARAPVPRCDRIPASRSLRESAARSDLGVGVCRMLEAMRARTMDIRNDRHFTWTLCSLDRVGRDRVVRQMSRIDGLVSRELSEATARLERSGEDPIPVTLALFAVDAAVASPRVEPGLLLV